MVNISLKDTFVNLTISDLMENRKKSRGDLEVRKRASRNKLKEMQDSSESDVPVVKRKKLSKKKPKGYFYLILYDTKIRIDSC